jgi:Zn-dependent protease with chaperone function
VNRKLFWVLFTLIILFGLVLRLYPAQNHNFYFTIDQGDDAVHAREFFDHGKLLTKGPETGIQGVYAGPGWDYFISVGYKIFNGDPYGALAMIAILNLSAIGFLMWWLVKRVSPGVALLVGASLQIFWPFYDSSRWAFSPFPLVASGIFLVISLTEFWQSKKRYWLGSIPVIVALNAELAGAIALLIFFGVVGIIGVVRKKLGIKEFLLSACLLPGVGLALTIKQLVQGYLRTHTIP